MRHNKNNYNIKLYFILILILIVFFIYIISVYFNFNKDMEHFVSSIENLKYYRCDDKKLLGIVSERDIVRACLHKCVDLEKLTVSEVVHKDITILKSNDLVEKAMQSMTETKRRHVLICDDKNELIAILSIGDLLYHLLDSQTRVIEQLENYIHTY